jgi:hypothetical protein
VFLPLPSVPLRKKSAPARADPDSFFFFRTQNTLEGRRADSSTRESIEALQNSTTQRFEELITLQRDREQREAEEGKQRESREEERLRMDRERHAMEMQKLKMEMTKLA